MIESGGSFVVRFTPPHTGTFIYHTHLHDERQLPLGLYGAAARWVDTCLRGGGSLFGDESPIWTKAVVDEAAAPLLIEDKSKGDFVTKLRDQVEELSDEAIRLVAALDNAHIDWDGTDEGLMPKVRGAVAIRLI